MNVKQNKVRMDTLHRACAGFAISFAVASCALEAEDIGPDAGGVEERRSDDDNLDLWTRVNRAPYHSGALSLSRHVVELKPRDNGSGEIRVEAALRWRDHAAGAVDPQVSFGLVTGRGDSSTLLQIFESGGLLHMRVDPDLATSDPLDVGVWYRVVLTIGDAPHRRLQVRILDLDGDDVWRSCDDRETECPSLKIDRCDLDDLRVKVTIDDVRHGKGHIQLQDISLQQDP